MNKQWLKLKMRRHIEARLSYIGLKDPTAVPPIDDDDIVELQDVHGNRIRVTRANAERSQTLRNLIEDAGTDNPIPLPNVRGRALWNLETVLNLPPGQEYDGTRLSDDALLDLLVAATFLDLEDLIYQLLPAWTSRSSIFPKFPFLTRPNDPLDPRSSLKALIPKALYFVRPDEGRRMGLIFLDLPDMGVNIPDKLRRQFEEFGVYQYKPDVVLKVAARNGEVGVVNQLLKNPKLNPNDAFLAAVVGGHLEVTKRLLQDTRVDPAIRFNAALTWAARKNDYDIVKLLLTNERVDPTILATFSDPRLQELYQEAMKNRSAKTRLEAPLCISCRVPGKAVMACGQCMEAFYCGYECQRADWTRHAAHCGTKK